jgi:hypothetical protein
MYKDPNTQNLLGEIPVTADISVTTNGKKFGIVTPKRTYQFKDT